MRASGAPTVPAELRPGEDVRGRPVPPADMVRGEGRAACGLLRNVRVWTRPPTGPGPVELEIEVTPACDPDRAEER